LVKNDPRRKIRRKKILSHKGGPRHIFGARGYIYLEKAERQNFFSGKEFLDQGLQNGIGENSILDVGRKLDLFRKFTLRISKLDLFRKFTLRIISTSQKFFWLFIRSFFLFNFTRISNSQQNLRTSLRLVRVFIFS
jgi:hypothetical protein